MSQTERNTGRLKPVSYTVDDLIVMMEKAGVMLTDWNDPRDPENLTEALLDLHEADGKELIGINGQLYQVVDHKRTDELEWAEVTKMGDGTIKFDTCHYNGGAHWAEVVEEAMKEGGVK